MIKATQQRTGTPEDYYNVPEGEDAGNLQDAYSLTMCRARGTLKTIICGFIEQDAQAGGTGKTMMGNMNMSIYQDLASALESQLDQLDKLAAAFAQSKT